MEKKKYITPMIEEIETEQQDYLLTGSGEKVVIPGEEGLQDNGDTTDNPWDDVL